MEPLKANLTFRTKLEAEVVGLYEVRGPKDGMPRNCLVLYNIRNQNDSVCYEMAFLKVKNLEEVKELSPGNIINFAARVEYPCKKGTPVLGWPRGIKKINRRTYGNTRQRASLHTLLV